jgi:hypothetical protein
MRFLKGAFADFFLFEIFVPVLVPAKCFRAVWHRGGAVHRLLRSSTV